ncbi:MAG: 4-(cytidine 5'-diphospho)-2-C-methyl-D-erythritol kinase [Bacteroidales bacterium]|nr:4-(cytidine 5'-diphospho)-2-C-methyl-D-erythritol kinase [Bacteroidales bacterium]
MICFPNAKINLGLFVTEKRPDGFHNIETILFPIPLCDVLEITVETGHASSSLHVHGIEIDGDPKDNLIFRALELLKNDFDLPNMRINLLKRIPFGAGLGGGSSDATLMLKMLNEKFLLNISNEKLEDYARQIGSDCAFFVKNKPTFAYEKGDKFKPINLALWGYRLVLICPPIHVNTKSAYQDISPKPAELDLQLLPNISVNKWKDILQNDFEPSVFAQHPILADIKQNLYDAGAVYVSMSGSGSAMFGLFPGSKFSKYRILQSLPSSICKESKVFMIDLASSKSSISKLY